MQEISYQLKPAALCRTVPLCPAYPLPFGKLRTDHMFLMDYGEGAWQNPRIVEYQPLALLPGAIALNYGQEIFEGAKAFQHPDGELYTFRFEQHAERFNLSASLLEMPTIPLEDQLQAVETLLDLERFWFPQQEGASIYIRPQMLGVEDTLGVRSSSTYLYVIFLSPSGFYYSKGVSPLTLLITDKFHRAVSGGTGNAKTGGNYAASLRATAYAKSKDADGVLYLDATNRFLEETGAMNHYHAQRNSRIVIPAFTDTILRSVTACSFLELSSRLECEVTQETVSLESFLEGLKSGIITETGGLGTAAVVAPVGKYLLEMGLRSDSLEEILVGSLGTGPLTKKMYALLSSIQLGQADAPPGWLRKVPRKNNSSASNSFVW